MPGPNSPRNAGSKPPAHASERARRRRLAAKDRTRAARVLVCDPDDGPGSIRATLLTLGYEVPPCATLADALRESSVASCDLVIAVLGRIDPEALRLLQLLRRVAPAKPLVLVANEGSVETRTRCQSLRPYYFAVKPVPPGELREVVVGALASGSGRG